MNATLGSKKLGVSALALAVFLACGIARAETTLLYSTVDSGGNTAQAGPYRLFASLGDAGHPLSSSALNYTMTTGVMAVSAQITGNLVEGEGEGEVVIEGEGEVVIEGEGEVIIEGEGEIVIEGEGEVTIEGEGEIVVEGEGEIVIEGEGEIIAEGEGEIIVEGEGEVIAEGEGEVIAEGEGEVITEGEGEVIAEGEVITEGEGENIDTTAPVITLEGEPEMTLEAKVDTYVEPGATALDDRDGDISHLIQIEGEVDTDLIDDYLLTYTVSDAAGNPAIPLIRTVHVVDSLPPLIELEGETDMSVPVGNPFAEPGYSAWDIYDGDLTSIVEVSGSVDENLVETYPLQYTVSDHAGNAAAPVTRLVHIYDGESPVIQLEGEPEMTLEAKVDTYSEPGATAWDAYDGDVSGNLVIVGAANTAVIGDYSISYNAEDGSGNPAPEVLRTIHVRDTRPPFITLLGASSVEIEAGTLYNDAGATAADLYDGDLTAGIAVTNTVNTGQAGAYYVRYTISDSSGNAAAPVTRIVQVLPKAAVEGEDEGESGNAGIEGEGEGEPEPVKPKFPGCGASSDSGTSPMGDGLALISALGILLIGRRRSRVVSRN